MTTTIPSKVFLLALLFAVVFSVPLTTQAYVTTAQSATKLTDNMAMFTVSFFFVSNKYDFTLPIAAQRNDQFTKEPGPLRYSLLGDGEVIEGGEVTGIVLSNAAIEGVEYKVERSKRENFGLVVFATLSEEMMQAYENFSVQVEALPFTLFESDDSYPNGLNESELRKYVTPEIDL